MFTDLVLFNYESRFVDDLKIDRLLSTKIIDKQSDIKNAKFPIIFKGEIQTIRKLIETKKIDIVTNLEEIYPNDNLNFRSSGIDQVVCKLASKNNIAVAFNFSLILNNDSFNRAKFLGRMMQNVRLFRKYKVKMIIASFASNEFELRSKDALRSFGICIGMNPKEAKDATEYLNKLVSRRS